LPLPVPVATSVPAAVPLPESLCQAAFLMYVPRMLRLEIVEERLAMLARPKGQPQLNVGAFHPTSLVLGKASHNAREHRVGWLETRGQKVLQTILDFAGKE
jgi:hypothetical protein